MRAPTPKPDARKWAAVYSLLPLYDEAQVAAAIEAVETAQRRWTVRDLAQAACAQIDLWHAEAQAVICSQAQAAAAAMAPITHEAHQAERLEWMRRSAALREHQAEDWRRSEAARRAMECRVQAERQAERVRQAAPTVARAMALGRQEASIAA